MKLADALRIARERANLSLADAMQASGVNDRTISAFERGEIEPQTWQLVRLHRAYSTDRTAIEAALRELAQ